MSRLWYWLACVLQRRAECRVSKAEKIADQLIIDADRGYARALRILPPREIYMVQELGGAYEAMGPHMRGDPFFAAMARGAQQSTGAQQHMQNMGGLIAAMGHPASGAALGSLLGQLTGRKF